MGVGEEVRLAGWGVSVQFTKMGGVKKEQREGFWLAKVVWVLVAKVGAVWGCRSSWGVSVATVFHVT